jgi:tryptophan synthase beta chain
MQSTPRAAGFFGEYGGQFLPESIKVILNELAVTFESCKDDPAFIREFESYLKDYSGRPTPLYLCENLTRELGGAKIYLKREDLNHLGAHKINNTIGQILLAKRMGKKKIIAETGAGQHGVATSATAALMGMECTVYMGSEDIKRQRLNVFRMEMLGARVVPAQSGQQTLKEAVDEAIAAWVEDIDNSYYLLGSAVGPHPYPTMVKYFQSVISKEAREQIQEKENRLPDYLVACVGGGSNAIGMFAEFIQDESVKLHGVEPAGRSMNLGDHAASLTTGTPGVLHGFNSYMIKDGEGGILYGQRSGCSERLFRSLENRRDRPGPGIRPCPGPCHASRTHSGPGADHRGQSLRSWRQGRGPDRGDARPGNHCQTRLEQPRAIQAAGYKKEPSTAWTVDGSFLVHPVISTLRLQHARAGW